MSRPCRACGQDGDGDARCSGQADCWLAPPWLRTWFRCRYRAGLRNPGPDRLCRPFWVYRHRHGVQHRVTVVRRGKDGQILVSSRVAGAVEAVAQLEDLGNLELKGLRRPVAAFNVTELITGARTSFG